MRFLIIDDDAEYRQLLRYHLEVEWPDAVIDEHRAELRGTDAHRRSISPTSISCCSVTPSRPDEGFELPAAAAPARAIARPCCCSPRESDEFLAVDALKAGAANFFPKDRVKHQRLIDVVRGELRVERLDPTGALLVDHKALNGTSKRRLVAKLYAGDLSSVYLAESDESGERIALKVLRHVPDAGGGRLFDRFLQEYEVIARVRHAERRAHLRSRHRGRPRVYRDGVSWAPAASRERLRQALEPAIARANTLRQIAGALAAIHDAGILHRDLEAREHHVSRRRHVSR